MSSVGIAIFENNFSQYSPSFRDLSFRQAARRNIPPDRFCRHRRTRTRPFADGPDHLTLIPTPHDIRRHNPPLEDPDSRCRFCHHPAAFGCSHQPKISHRAGSAITARLLTWCPDEAVIAPSCSFHSIWTAAGFPQERHFEAFAFGRYACIWLPALGISGGYHIPIFDSLSIPPSGASARTRSLRFPRQQTSTPATKPSRAAAGGTVTPALPRCC